jgi:5-hydroxyisourate hydrolase-like protein (transthyretin family)
LLNMNDMAKGVYVLKVDTGDQFKAVKIIKE